MNFSTMHESDRRRIQTMNKAHQLNSVEKKNEEFQSNTEESLNRKRTMKKNTQNIQNCNTKIPDKRQLFQ